MERWAIIAITFAMLLAPAPVLAADHPLFQPPATANRAEKLKQIEASLRGKERQDTMALGAMALQEWLRYPTLARTLTHPSKSGPSAQAVRDYQTARRIKPTGVLDADSLLRLTEDFDLIQKLNLTNAIQLLGWARPVWHELRGYEWVTVDGTWVITNDASAAPLQTSEIACDRTEKKCHETTVIFRDGSVSIVKADYSILSWDRDGVRAASSTASCADYVMHIRRVEDQKPGTEIPGLVTGHRTVKTGGRGLLGEPCGDSLTPHLSLRLEKGYVVQQRYRDELWKALGYPNPKATEANR